MALGDRVIHLLDRALLERALQGRVRGPGLGDHHQSRRPHVQAVHDALALRGALGGQGHARVGECARHGGTLPAGRGMGSDAHRLVDHGNVGVLIDDGQPAGNGRLGHRGPGLWEVDGEDALAYGIGPAHGRAFKGHAAAVQELSGLGAAHAQHARHGHVGTLADQRVGHRKVAGIAHGVASSVVAGLVDGGTNRRWPNRLTSMKTTAAPTIAMSATLPTKMLL